MTLPLTPRYILCRFEAIQNSEKTNKIPLHPSTLTAHNPLDPSIHMDYQTALSLATLHGCGLGFVFVPQDGYFLIDLDNCITPDGQWTPIASEGIQQFPGAYFEVSNSRRGLHIIGRYTGSEPAHSCRHPENELYTSGRYVALACINPTGSAETDHTPALTSWINKYFPTNTNTAGFQTAGWTTTAEPGCNPPEDDIELIRIMLSARATPQEAFGSIVPIRDLWEANETVLAQNFPTQTLGEPYDRSAADSALAYRLMYWTGGNCERTVRLMCMSKLNRDKYERADYLPRTVARARGEQRNFNKYDYHNHEENNNTVATVSQHMLDITNVHELFRGCVYVVKEHRVFMPHGELIKPEVFRSFFGGYSFPMDFENAKRSRNAWEAFNESFVFRKPQVDECRFNPLATPATIIQDGARSYINTYIPIDTKRVVASVELFLQHVANLLPDPRDQLILLSYMAALVQYKGKKFTWCLIIQGVQGNGKSFLTEVLRYCIGSRYTHTAKSAEITGRFNGWMYGSLLIAVDDIKISNSDALEILKPMITNHQQEIERKGVDKATQDIYCNFILNTNHKDGVRKTESDRRFCPLFTAQQTASDLTRDGMEGDYFLRLFDWFNNQDGNAAINEFLSTFSIPDEFNPATKCMRAPVTTATAEAIEQGIDPTAQKILEWVEEGQIGFRGGWLSSMMITRKLLDENIKINPKQLPLLLESIGYKTHPALIQGRSTRILKTDNGKPRLYIHSSKTINLSLDPMNQYENDQK